MIEKLYDRKNMIVRKSVNLSKQTHIIAANIDQAILMITLQSPLTTTGFIDRFLVSAQAFGVEVILFFNKIDLYSKKLILQNQNLIHEYSKIGYRCISLSVLNDNINEVKSIVENKNNLISGHSGVGKSTLINKLLGTADISTNEISQRHDQGQHTTTFSELYRLDFGGTIIDTPGIKGFGLVNIDVDNFIFICGRYKGVDQRVIDKYVTHEYSIGDYVVSNGELSSLVMIDSIVRLNPGTLNNINSAKTDSFSSALLDYPHYTKPRTIDGLSVPRVLLGGHHEKIKSWRKSKSEDLTKQKRPDLWKKYNKTINQMEFNHE